MRTRQGTTLQSLRAAKSFLDEHAAELAGVINTGARKRLDDAIAALDSHASEQTGNSLAAQGLTQKQRALRVVLLQDHMRAIARIATADLPNTPEFAPLRMPRGRPTPEKLAAAASGMAKVALQHLAVFTAAGLPDDFVDQLSTASESMVTALVDRTRTQSKRTGATIGLNAKLIEGRKVVGILDAFVRTALRGNLVLLGEWASGIHIRSLSTPAAPAPTAPVAPAATDPSTTTVPAHSATPTSAAVATVLAATDDLTKEAP